MSITATAPNAAARDGANTAPHQGRSGAANYLYPLAVVRNAEPA
jgi:hypothetical protein